ncbi:hypothetical protein CDAR_174811 [Caerostris darwini]|uniref:C2H2-type domain-containing protein n=1 Tax=Caerostris darwini TaxID=1538125 RepID=A0AAV4VQ89_9ARAC|nr:hypothetical protein CDAR_174811 [Caerostris darwini]
MHRDYLSDITKYLQYLSVQTFQDHNKSFEAPETAFRIEIISSFDETSMCSLKYQKSGSETYHCTYCTYTTSYKGNLKTHMVTHVNNRPFVCNVCHKSFNHKVALKTHFRLHSGERPYKCDICGRAFIQRGALNYHEKTHLKAEFKKLD